MKIRYRVSIPSLEAEIIKDVEVPDDFNDEQISDYIVGLVLDKAEAEWDKVEEE
jgi:hypothetical protein